MIYGKITSEARLTGNTHFPMLDLNHQAVADLLSNWLAKKGLNEEK